MSAISSGTARAEPKAARAAGTAPDGKGQFEYVADPKPMSDDVGDLNPVDPRLYGTPKQPVPKTVKE